MSKPRVVVVEAGKKKKKKKANGVGVASGDMDRTVTVKGAWYFQDSTAASVVGQPLNPLVMDARLLALSDLYQEFRFTSVKITVYSDSNGGKNMALAYTPIVFTTAPTLSTLPSLARFAMGCGGYGSPYPTLKLSSRELTANPPKWFRRGTAYDDLLETQGFLYWASTANFATNVAQVIIEYVVQLRAKADASLTMERPLVAQPVPTDPSIQAALGMIPNPRVVKASPGLVDEQKSSFEDELVLVPRSRVKL